VLSYDEFLCAVRICRPIARTIIYTVVDNGKVVFDLRVLAVREICEEPDVLINRMITVFTFFLQRCDYFEDMIAKPDSTCDLFARF
jgi:hypothetical protein